MVTFIHKVEYTWAQFLACAQEPSPAGSTSSRGYKGHMDPRDPWYGGVSFDEALTLALEGWREGVNRIAPVSAKMTEKVTSTMEVTDWSYDVESGGNLDIARYLDGEPECWLTPNVRHIAGQGKLLTLIVNVATFSRFNAEEFFQRGAAVVSLVDCLERAGHSVKIILGAANEHQDSAFQVLVTVKDFGEVLHIGRIAFVLAHVAINRRLMFSVEEKFPANIRRRCDIVDRGGYGRPCPLEVRGDIYIDRMLFDRHTPESWERWIIEQLREQGVVIREEGK